MTPTPPNLRALFGNRFRVSHDPAAVDRRSRNDPWMQTLLCENGVVYPHGANCLAVECKGATAKNLLRLPGVTVHQRGDTEWTLLFDLAAFDAVAAILKPRKRRKLSVEKRQAMADHIFKPDKHVPAARESPKFASGAAKAAKIAA